MIKPTEPLSLSTSAIRWVFFTFLPSISVQKVITSPFFRELISSISFEIIRSPFLKVGFIESDSTVSGIYPSRLAVPLFLSDENTRIVISSAKISTTHAITLKTIFKAFFIIQNLGNPRLPPF